MNPSITALRGFLDASHSVYHAIDHLEKTLSARGYVRVREQDSWDLTPGGAYYLIRGGCALIAFRVPRKHPQGFVMSASHCDRPCFKLKENFTLTGPYTRLGVERYGGMIMSTWLDRPLSLAGRVTVETDRGLETRLVDIDKDLLLIPSVAIHMNRQCNDGYKWNPAVDLLPLIGGKDAAGKLEKLLEEQAGGRILGHDLYLYIRQKSSVWGIDDEYISSAALDDLQCVWGCAQGFLQAEESSSAPVLCVFDSEEVGSCSVQGAGSTFLSNTLERICQAAGWDFQRMLAQSFLVSADNAHALHPNHPEYADGANAPVMGGGPVIKFNSNLSYCTDGLTGGLFRKVCAMADVPVQTYYNRGDLPGGSTLGRISLAQVSVPTVDIGLPQLAMHACFETAAVSDAIALEKAMAAYYSLTLRAGDHGWDLTENG